VKPVCKYLATCQGKPSQEGYLNCQTIITKTNWQSAVMDKCDSGNIQKSCILYLYVLYDFSVNCGLFPSIALKSQKLAMVKCGVLFEVQTEFLNVIYTSFGFKG
jgi:hypothetical protein